MKSQIEGKRENRSSDRSNRSRLSVNFVLVVVWIICFDVASAAYSLYAYSKEVLIQPSVAGYW